jgi:hypothetical protein
MPTFGEAVKKEHENIKKQKESKYSDADIKGCIQDALLDSPGYSQKYSLIALAMIEYNRMIDERCK